MRHLKTLTIFIAIIFASACGDDGPLKKPEAPAVNNVNNTDGPGDNPGDNNSNNENPNNSNGTNNLNNANNTNNANNIDDGSPVCGDEMIEGDEECEGSTSETCADFGFDGGTTSCNNCMVDTSQCTRVTCGDGVVDNGEACDDGALNGTYGHCNSNCSGSGPRCGDGVLNGEEVCDAGQFRGDTCATQGFDGGELGCTSECLLDTSSCTSCGDGVVEGPEVCDDGSSNGTYGSCNNACTGEGPRCGDGIVNGSEECDGSNLSGATCASEGAGLGSVSCTTSCFVDTSSCSMAPRAGEVIFTEVMNNPNISYDNDGEWFEVRNLSTRTIDLQGCMVYSTTSTGDESFDVLASVMVGASDYATFGRSNQAPFVADYTYNALINLNNSTDSLELHCDDPITGQSTLVDGITWDDGATFPDPDGASMSLDPFSQNASSNDIGSNWCESVSTFGVGDKGTPGGPNDYCL